MAITAPGIALLNGTQANSSNDLAQSTLQLLNFSSADYDDTYFGWSGGDNTKLTIDTAGDYFFSVHVPQQDNTKVSTASTARNSTEIQVFVNGTKSDVSVGRASYMRNYLGGYHSTSQLTFYLKDLSATDYVQIKIVKKTSITRTINVDGQFTLFAQYVEADTIFAGTGTQSENGTDLSTATEYGIEWGVETRKDTGFTHSTVTASESITLDDAGYYFVSYNIPLGDGTTQRTNVQAKTKLDSTEINGGRASMGYIRNQDSHSDASLHWSGIVKTTTTNQVLSIDVVEEAVDGTVTVDGEKATIYISKLSTDGLVILEATQVNSADNWSPSTTAYINWATSIVKDTGYFTHDTTTNNHEITFATAGDYLLTFNASFNTPSADRVQPRATIYLDTGSGYAAISGAISASGYIRNTSQFQSSDSFCFPITSIGVGDKLKIEMDNAGTTGSTADSTPAQLSIKALSTLSYTSPQYAYTSKLNTGTDNIDEAVLYEKDVSTPTGSSLAYHLSSDGGSTWESVTPGTPHTMVANSNDLRARITLSNTDTAVTPTVNEISVVWTASAGGATTNDTRAAKATGKLTSNDTRSVKLTGEDFTTNTRAAKTTGKLTDNDTRASKVTGQDTSNDTRGAKTTGNATANNTRSAKTVGNASANDVRSAKTTGKNTDADTRAAKTTGTLGASDTRDSKITGIDTANDTRSSKVAGKLTTNDTRLAKTTGIAGANDQRSAKTHGVSTTNDTRSSKVAGKLTDSDTRAAKTSGQQVVNNTISAKVTGEQNTNDSRIAKTIGKQNVSNTRSAKSTGQFSTNNTRSAKATGKENASDVISAKATGEATVSNTKDAKTTGVLSANDVRPAKITGFDTNSSEINAKLTGTFIDSDEINAIITGIRRSNSTRSAKITGKSLSWKRQNDEDWQTPDAKTVGQIVDENWYDRDTKTISTENIPDWHKKY